MKYKVGDKVEIKTWKEMEKEFGLDWHGNIDLDLKIGTIRFLKTKEEHLNRNFPNRIVEIKEINERTFCYSSKGIYFTEWNDYMIKGTVSELEKNEKINSRFELLDIRED